MEESDLSSTDYEMEAHGSNYLLPLTEWVAPGRSGLPPSPGLPSLAVYFLCMARVGDSYRGAHQRCNTAIRVAAARVARRARRATARGGGKQGGSSEGGGSSSCWSHGQGR